MSVYGDGSEEQALVDAALTDHVVAITAPGGESWTWVADHKQATAIWRYLRIVGAPLVTSGIGAEAAVPRRHGDT